jgi:SlyX protein
MNSRIDDLEVRFAYQEAAVEELTQTALEQQKLIEELSGQIEYLKTMLREIKPSAVASIAEETPPPHY